MELERLANEVAMDYICSMSLALAKGHYEIFDLYHEFYQSAFERIKDPHTRTQMTKLVDKLYETRAEK